MSKPGPIIEAVLGPTNTGKTYYAIEKMLEFNSGVFGLPLRLLAREVYDKCIKKANPDHVALITGEEKIIPNSARYYICTVESMPLDINTEFVCIDEIQMCADRERGHVFTDRLLNNRGSLYTLLLGSQVMQEIIGELIGSNIKFKNQERFSKLSFNGYKKVSRLERKSAVIAFSIEEVYAIAELIRRQKGGAAIVMGALSPKTRNAQVGLYQSGDVDFLVATDAIGMGLNMDLDQIYFSNLKKFDGKKTRRLNLLEISQIAGRAGRYKNDGFFGTTGECKDISAEEIEKIESHDLPKIKSLYWRNSQLNFKNLKTFFDSLEQKPTNPNLIRVYDSLDENVFRNIVKNNELNKDKIEHNLELFWECCQIPDFEKKAYGQHLNIVKSVFQFLTEGKKYIPNTFLKKELDGLDKTHNNLDVISNRISKVRTWAYVSNKKNWVENSDYWIQVTKQIEDNLSDRLHKELTQSFINKKISVLSKGLKQDLVLETNISDSNEVLINNQRIGVLKGLKLDIDVSSNTLDTDIKSIKKAARKGVESEIQKRIDAIKSGPIELKEDGKIYWLNNPIAKLKKGKDYLNPEIDLIADNLISEKSRYDLSEYIQSWLLKHINSELNDLLNLQKSNLENNYIRAITYQLYENNGVVKRESVKQILSKISTEDRKLIWKMGIKLGRYHIYLPKMIKPAAVNLRVILWNNFYGIDNYLETPKPGINFFTDKTKNKSFYLICGFENLSNYYIRIDILEKLFLNIIKNTKDKKFSVTSDMINLVGCTKEIFIKLIELLNYKKIKNTENYIYDAPMLRVKKRPYKAPNISNAFSVLKGLKL